MDIPIYLFSMVIKKKFCRRAGMGRLPSVAAGLAGGGRKADSCCPCLKSVVAEEPVWYKARAF